jgi:transposase
MPIITIGLDLAKSVFQLHAIDEEGAVVMRKRLPRSQVLPTLEKIPPCLVGMEACGSAHHWAREIQALGHDVRLMPAQYVKPYVKRNKTDAADAEAICEAVRRPTMRFVAIKTIEQQAVMLNHRGRELLVKQRTMLANAIRSHFAEFGIVTAQGTQNLCKLKQAAQQGSLTQTAMDVLELLFDQLDALNKSIKALELRIHAWHKSNEVSQRLTSIPGVGPLTASAIVASVGQATCFGSARSFAAWLGLTPREHSSGGKVMLGGISKRGDGYIRKLLVHGARAVVRMRSRKDAAPMPWLDGLLERKHRNSATVALAHKNARIGVALGRGQDPTFS